VCDAQGEELGSQHPKLFEALQINVPAVYGLIESFVRARVSACIILTYCCTCINVCLRAFGAHRLHSLHICRSRTRCRK